jgi:hypothetical protein
MRKNIRPETDVEAKQRRDAYWKEICRAALETLANYRPIVSLDQIHPPRPS